MHSIKQIFGICLLAVLIVFGSCKREDPNPTEPKEIINGDISEWIYYNMNYMYFWKEYIPKGLNPLSEDDPKNFFYTLLYDSEDKWSYITDDYISFSMQLEGSPLAMGYSPAFGLFNSAGQVIIVVEYVYKDTPASKAGLERGDIIFEINGILLDTLNYRELFYQDSYTIGLAEYNDTTLIETGETISLTAEIISANPVLHYEIIDTLGFKTGYLVYNEFISGAGDIFLRELDYAMKDFLDANITNLIVDLRYNPGGEIITAGYLASCIAPAQNVDNKDVLVSFVYNDLVRNDIVNRYGTEDALTYRFPGSTYNLNMNTVYFLTSNGSASASELVISGLEPYMEVCMIGEPTYGKYTGAWVIHDTEEPARHNWAIIPIVLKYANANGVTDFKDGLTPDHFIDDRLLNAVPFGDFSDPLFATAMSLITNNSFLTLKKSSSYNPHHKFYSPDQLIKRNLFIPKDIILK